MLLLTCSTYREELYNCSKLTKIQDRNVCRQKVTVKYRYVKEDPIEVNIYHSPRIQKNVVDFKQIFEGIEE